MESFEVRTSRTCELLDITGQVRGVAARNSGSRLCVVFVPHTTAGVTINENADPDVKRDILWGLEQIIKDEWHFHHGEGNSPAHIKASMMGSSVTIPVVDGRLVLGTWQGIFLAEFDGPRTRKVLIQCL